MREGKEGKAQEYALLKRKLWLVDLILTAGFLIGLLVSGATRSLGIWVANRVAGWPLQTAVYTSLLGIAFALATFPLEWFGQFKLEHRFGLSTESLPRWMGRWLKGFLVGGILGLIVVEGFVGLIRAFPENWWIGAALGWLAGSTLLTQLTPVLLIPLFYRQSPLADAALRQRLEEFLSRSRTKVSGLFEVDLSRSTRKANACLCGFGRTRRVLLSDTLLESHPPEEVEVVLAHEVGHHRLHHLGILIGLSALATGASCFGVDRAFGFLRVPMGLTGPEELAALPALALLFLAAGLLLMPALSFASRILEAQADRFALDQTRNPEAFVATMRRLAERNLAELNPPRWVEWLLYDHPPIGKRIAMAFAFEGDSPAGDTPLRGVSPVRTVPVSCLFCRIASKQIPAKIAYEDADLLAFHDINPQAPVHLQVIPKRHIARVSDLAPESAGLAAQMVLAANRLAAEFKIAEPGYRLVINCNAGAGQSVYHLHLHLLGGRPLKWPPG